MTPRFRPAWMNLGVALGLLLITSVGVLSVRSTLRARGDATWVTHSHAVLFQLESLMATATDAETGQRGYLLTGNAEFLAPYQQAVEHLDGMQSELGQLLADDPVQEQNLEALRPLLAERLQSMAGLVALGTAQPGGAASLPALRPMLEQGKQMHDALRQHIGAMKTHEQGLLAEREATATSSARTDVAVTLLGNGLGMVLVVAMLWWLRAELRRRKASELALTHSVALLDVARARAQESDRLKSVFLATMSHELRTPLNSIIGFTGILQQGLAGPVNAEQSKQLGMVLKSGRHLLALINDVLDISKIEAGELRVDRRPYDLCAVLAAAQSSVGPLAEKKGLLLSTRLNLPLAGVGCTQVGDSRRVQQVVINLLNNAIKFTERGEVALEAELLPGGQEVQLRVRDTGPGIAAQDLPKLFRAFQQLDTGLSRQHEGTGLGLNICHHLALLMGGRMDVQSQVGRGSVFSVTLPVKPKEEFHEPTDRSPD